MTRTLKGFHKKIRRANRKPQAKRRGTADHTPASKREWWK